MGKMYRTYNNMVNPIKGMGQCSSGKSVNDDNMVNIGIVDANREKLALDERIRMEGKAIVKEKEKIFREKLKHIHSHDTKIVIKTLDELREMLVQAWSTLSHGRDIAITLLDILLDEGYVKMILTFMRDGEKDLKIIAARLLEQSLTTRIRQYVEKYGLQALLDLSNDKSDELEDAGIGLLEHMLKLSEAACQRIISLGGLETIIEASKSEKDSLRKHAAKAMANLAMYGGFKNQKEMIKRNAHQWLFTLAFSKNPSVTYYACIAIAFLASNKEIEQEINESETLKLVNTFVAHHDPKEFGKLDKSQLQGRSMGWLAKMKKLLKSHNREAQTLAAFHFAMEATIKKTQGSIHELYEIDAVLPIKQVACLSVNDVACNLAYRALETIGEKCPPNLSNDITRWDNFEVKWWLEALGFTEYINAFAKLKVDGDLLLTIKEDDLKNDIKMSAAITRKRFLRELSNLKQLAEYSSCDHDDLSNHLFSLGDEYVQYTYNLLRAGITLDNITLATDDILKQDCGIENGVHRARIMEAVKGGNAFSRSTSHTFSRTRSLASISGSPVLDATEKSLDVFISYRRSTGSQLASLLKVHLQLRGFSVFIDVEKLEAGQFDNNLLNNVRRAKSFVLVLSDSALDRCIGDTESKDWVHKEITTALQSQCNIVPILHQFKWPPLDSIPEDMRNVSFFNGVKWIHDYQDACMDKLERFLRNPKPPKLDEPVKAN
ncbi:unnamed protein product [Owenia fusiformis]|uniref:ADP-ribosyl cyclase/cyclic ADP-ribose hydrolase n=1 Tax=Owenia fusiformis TaxID=6347 RepID=A0A8J1XGD0_OWEFU|nr:unnamed protein product [Owenia fusiformis]